MQYSDLSELLHLTTGITTSMLLSNTMALPVV
jgi:hypothetical protein